MRAVIGKDTTNSFSWSLDETITPDLVNKIEKFGDAANTKWFEFEFYEIVTLLLEKYNLDQIEEMLYDEDPEIIDLGAIVLDQSLLVQNDQNLRDMIRLYFPVMQVIVKKMRG